MKKLLLVAVVAVSASLVSNAQITKGSLLLGGGLSFGNNKTEQGAQEIKNNLVLLNPSVGVAVKTNLVFGVGATYGRTESESNTSKVTSNSAGGNLFLRKYSLLGKGFYLFGELAGGYLQRKDKTVNGTNYIQETKASSISAALYPGIAYAVNKKFHLEVGIPSLVSLSYNQRDTRTTAFGNVSSDKSNGFSFMSNVSSSNPLSVGFRIVLGK